MPEPLATAEHYTALYGAPADPGRLDGLLAKASRIIRAEAARVGVDIDERITEGLDADLVADVACDMAAYVLRGSDIVGAVSTTQTAGPFSQAVQLQAPSGAMLLTRAHRRALGLPAQTAWQADLLPGETP